LPPATVQIRLASFIAPVQDRVDERLILPARIVPAQGRDDTGFPTRFNCQRAMTPHSRNANAPRVCMNRSPSKKEGAGKAGWPMHPKPRVRNKTKHTSVVATGSPDQSGLPCAMVLTAYSALPGDRAFLPPSPPRSFASQELDASVGASDHTTSPSAGSAARLATPSASTASRLNVRDDAQRPSSEAGRGEIYTRFAFRKNRNIFGAGAGQAAGSEFAKRPDGQIS